MRAEIKKYILAAALFLVIGPIYVLFGVVDAERRSNSGQAIYSAKSDIESLASLANEYRRLHGRSPSTFEEFMPGSVLIGGKDKAPRLFSPWGTAYGLRIDSVTGRPIVWCAVPSQVASLIHVAELSSETNWEAVLKDVH
jgi:hypothetical protein